MRLRRGQAGTRDVPLPSPPPPGSPLDALPPKDDSIPAFRQQQYERWLRAEIARLRRSPTVEASLRVARLSERISPELETSLRKDWANANATVAKLSGVRRNELAYVIGTVRTLAAAHMLTVDRLRPVFLVLRTNTRFWANEPLPASGFRTSPYTDPAVFQYYPGHGMQLQPLRQLGPRERDRRRLPGRDAQPHQARHVPPGRAGQEPRPAVRARRAPQRLPRLGVLLRLRDRARRRG